MVANQEIVSKLNRKERGQLLAQNHEEDIEVTTEGYKVPSQTQENQQYTVRIGKEKECTCPDHQKNENKCKHIRAVELTVTRRVDEGGNVEITKELTEAYTQDWGSYNQAQEEETKRFMELLSKLSETVEEPEYDFGRPTKSLQDMIFACGLKVYSGFSLRRFQSLMEIAEEKGYVEDTCHYSTVSKYMQKEEIQEVLHQLIERSASPLTVVETKFGVDSSGFSTSTFGKYFSYKHGEEREVREWVKTHIMTGVKTNIVTGVQLDIGNKHDTTQFEPLVEKTAEQFNIEEVSADKAYNSRDNYQLVADLGGEAYIPFREGSTGRSKGSPAWKKMYHKFQYEAEEFRDHYGKRSNVETAFHMIKQKFDEDVNSKKEISQKNEVLLKILSHNICVLIHEMINLEISPEFG